MLAQGEAGLGWGTAIDPVPNCQKEGGACCTVGDSGWVEICSWGLAWAPWVHAGEEEPPEGRHTHTQLDEGRYCRTHMNTHTEECESCSSVSSCCVCAHAHAHALPDYVC